MKTDITELAQREKFEAWAEHACAAPWGYLKKRRTTEGYSEQIYTCMWTAWKAASAELVEALKKAHSVMSGVVTAAAIRGVRPFDGIDCDPPTLEENAEACGDAMSARIRELEANPPKPHHNGLMQISNELASAKQCIAELESRTATAAAADVLAERQRQVTTEGWAPAHDDEYEHGELADAAGCYALSSELFDCAGEPPRPWPWPDEWWKPTSRRRDLVKAGALILAEIERIDRAESRSKGRNQPGMVVAVHVDAGDFVKVKDQVFEVEETDFDDHDVTLWFIGGQALKCAAGCPIEVVLAPGEED